MDSLRRQQISDFFANHKGLIQDLYGDIMQLILPPTEDEIINFLINDIKINDGDCILDCGCGVGYIDILLAKHFQNINIQAIDICSDLLERGKSIAYDAQVENKVVFQEVDFEKIIDFFEPQSFDKIIFLESLFYSKNIQEIINQTNKLLKPNGTLYIKESFIFTHVPGSTQEANAKQIRKQLDEFTFYHPIQINELVKIVEENNFMLDNVTRHNFYHGGHKIKKFFQESGINLYDLIKDSLDVSIVNGHGASTFLQQFTCTFSPYSIITRD